MDYRKKVLMLGSLFVLVAGGSPLLADVTPALNRDQETDDEQFKIIRDYIDNKRNISLKEKGGTLRIGGDVRVEMKGVNQKLDGQRVEGDGIGGGRVLANGFPTTTNIPSYWMDINAALSFEYQNGGSEANLLLKMNNRAGLDNTNFDEKNSYRRDYRKNYAPGSANFSVAKAYIAYPVLDDESYSLNVEFGRQRMFDLFDSRVMMVNRFDGLAVKYRAALEGVGRAHATYGAFLISDRAHHFGQVVQLHLREVADTGLNLGYLLADWRNTTYSDFSKDIGNVKEKLDANDPTKNTLYQGLNLAFRFLVSQFSASYTLPDDLIGQHLRFYGAYLYNHKAIIMQDNKAHDRSAWYVGATLGKIAMPGDYALDLAFQSVSPNSVPDFDSYGGAGRGNLTGVPANEDPSQGNNNFKGVRLQLAYCATPDVLFNLKGVYTKAADDKLTDYTGTRHSDNDWKSIALEMVYSF